MTKLVFALIALAALVGAVAPATALDAKTFFEQQDRQSGN
jgi:hypothetical protein